MSWKGPLKQARLEHSCQIRLDPPMKEGMLPSVVTVGGEGGGISIVFPLCNMTIALESVHIRPVLSLLPVLVLRPL